MDHINTTKSYAYLQPQLGANTTKSSAYLQPQLGVADFLVSLVE